MLETDKEPMTETSVEPVSQAETSDAQEEPNPGTVTDETPQESHEESFQSPPSDDHQTRIQELEEMVGNLQSGNRKLYEDLLRLKAESENFKKRLQREKNEDLKRMEKRLILMFLPVLDNFDLALHSAPDSSGSFVQGIQMIQRQFLDVLSQMEVEPLESLNRPFDPYVHEALSQLPREDVAPDTVIQVIQKGYLFRQELLRPAKVVVSTAVQPADDTRGDSLEALD